MAVFTTRPSPLISRVSIRGLPLPSTCPQLWGVLEGPQGAMLLPPSSTSCSLPTSNPTPRCCTITWLRTDRAVLASEASLAASSRRARSTSPAMAAPHTGATDSVVCLSVYTAACPPILTDQTIEGQTILQHRAKTHYHPSPPTQYSPFQIYGCCM